MSYDIRFKVKVQDKDIYLDIGYCHANVTWNVRGLIVQSTGLKWENEANNGRCTEVIPQIACGLSRLANNPERYEPYTSSSGWGTIQGTIRFFTEILEAWEDLQKDEPELADIATFWIE